MNLLEIYDLFIAFSRQLLLLFMSCLQAVGFFIFVNVLNENFEQTWCHVQIILWNQIRVRTCWTLRWISIFNLELFDYKVGTNQKLLFCKANEWYRLSIASNMIKYFALANKKTVRISYVILHDFNHIYQIWCVFISKPEAWKYFPKSTVASQTDIFSVTFESSKLEVIRCTCFRT